MSLARRVSLVVLFVIVPVFLGVTPPSQMAAKRDLGW